jgi:hypothetical protein
MGEREGAGGEREGKQEVRERLKGLAIDEQG